MPEHKAQYAQDHRDQNDKQKNQKQRVANNSVGLAQSWTRSVCVWVKSVQMKNDEVCGDNPIVLTAARIVPRLVSTGRWSLLVQDLLLLARKNVGRMLTTSNHKAIRMLPALEQPLGPLFRKSR